MGQDERSGIGREGDGRAEKVWSRRNRTGRGEKTVLEARSLVEVWDRMRVESSVKSSVASRTNAMTTFFGMASSVQPSVGRWS